MSNVHPLFRCWWQSYDFLDAVLPLDSRIILVGVVDGPDHSVRLEKLNFRDTSGQLRISDFFQLVQVLHFTNPEGVVHEGQQFVDENVDVVGLQHRLNAHGRSEPLLKGKAQAFSALLESRGVRLPKR